MIHLPKDAEGREIPLDTKVMYGYGGTARNIVYWVFTTDSDLEKEWRNCWRELTDGGRPLGKMTLAEVLDVIAENPRRFIEQYKMYREEVIRLGGKL